MIFDCVPPLSSKEFFEERVERAAKQLTLCKQANNVEIVGRTKCTGFDHLHAVLADVLEKVQLHFQHCNINREVRASYFASPIRYMTTDGDLILCSN
jgi:hypothetical protein